MRVNMHTHSVFCDGKDTPREMIETAIEKGFDILGFSGHGHSPCDDVSMSPDATAEYIRTIRSLQKEYQDRITIYLGIEQDYYSVEPIEYDYILGSVHYVYKNGEYLPVDLSAKAMKEFVDKHYNGDVYSYCEDYFELVGDLYNKTKCQIIGHFDLVTKFNEQLPMIDINHPRYVKAYTGALEKLLLTPVIFEINTGAISRGYRTGPYPDDNMIDIIAKSGRPFVICSDTHSVDTVATELESEREKLEKKGYSYIKSLKEIID